MDDARPWQPERLSRAGDDSWVPPIARLPHLRRIRRVNWRSVPEHSIVLAGAEVNGAPAPELVGFPPMNGVLKQGLLERYRFLPRHGVLIAEPVSPVVAAALSSDIRTLHAQVTSLREVLGDFEDERARVLNLLGGNGAAGPGAAGGDAARSDAVGSDVARGNARGGAPVPLFETEGVTRVERLVKDQYNSFTVSLNPGVEVPSFLFGRVSRRVTVSELILRELERQGRAAVPLDLPVTLHVALDVSFSMRARRKLEEGLTTLNRLCTALPRVLSRTRVIPYLYSDAVRDRMSVPVERPGIAMRGTKLAPLFKRVLGNASGTTRNKLVVITDGETEDQGAALAAAGALRDRQFDFTHVLIHDDEDMRSIVTDEYAHLLGTDGIVDDDEATRLDEEGTAYTRRRSDVELQRALDERFAAFTAVTERAGGNQVVVTLVEALALVNLEVYDRYMGLLSLV